MWIITHRIHVWYIYANMNPINIPQMLAYIPYLDQWINGLMDHYMDKWIIMWMNGSDYLRSLCGFEFSWYVLIGVNFCAHEHVKNLPLNWDHEIMWNLSNVDPLDIRPFFMFFFTFPPCPPCAWKQDGWRPKRSPWISCENGWRVAAERPWPP